MRLGAGSPAGGGVEQQGFLDAGEVVEQFADGPSLAGADGLAAHELGDRERGHAVGDVHPDLLVGPVPHRGEGDQVGVFELAEAALGVVLGPVAGDHLGDRPVLAVGDQDAFAEQLALKCAAGCGVDGPGQAARPGPGR